MDLKCEQEAIVRLGSISGLIIDTEGISVADAPIEISGLVERTSVSDEKGLFRMEDIPEGLYEVRVVADSYYVRIQRLVVNFAKTALIELRVVERPDEPLITVANGEIKLLQKMRFERRFQVDLVFFR